MSAVWIAAVQITQAKTETHRRPRINRRRQDMDRSALRIECAMLRNGAGWRRNDCTSRKRCHKKERGKDAFHGPSARRLICTSSFTQDSSTILILHLKSALFNPRSGWQAQVSSFRLIVLAAIELRPDDDAARHRVSAELRRAFRRDAVPKGNGKVRLASDATKFFPH